jgi:hypothetical protein
MMNSSSGMAGGSQGGSENCEILCDLDLRRLISKYTAVRRTQTN